MIYVLLPVFIFFLWLVLAPSFGKGQSQNEDTRRMDLEEERELLLEQLLELENQPQGDTQEELYRASMRIKVPLSRILDELEQLPPMLPTQVSRRPVSGLTLGLALGITLLLVVGTFSFLSSWQQSGLATGDVRQLKLAIQLPTLERQAQKGDAKTLLAFADANFDLERYGIASNTYAQVLKKNPKEPRALRRFGLLILQSDPKYQKQGLEFIKKSVVLDPTTVEGYIFLAALQIQMGQKSEALSTLEQAAKVDPKNETVKSLLTQVDPKKVLVTDPGERLYTQNCSSCHGINGEGKSAPSLQKSVIILDAEALRSVIQKGKGGMPAFPNLTDQDLEHLIQFVGSLRR